jgi:hypothetical protein
MTALQLYYLECMRANELRQQFLEAWKRPSTQTYTPVSFKVRIK